MMLRQLRFLTTVALLSVPVAAIAQDAGAVAATKSEPAAKAAPKPKTQPKPKPAAPSSAAELTAWTNPPTEGPAALDFSMVGEFAGEFTPSEEPIPLALQIRCVGDGQFEAHVVEGGLPGQDGYREESVVPLIGRRSGATLVLSGGPWALIVTGPQCLVISETGQPLGTLTRVERSSPTLGAAPPEDAKVLFDGQSTDAFAGASMTEDGLLQAGANINEMLMDFDLHLEFRIPYMPTQTDQKRGNSGIYLQSRYECQILDSFAADRVFNGLGALYRFKSADINMALPPLAWQTYDIRFTAARFAADGAKLRNARISSWVNGVQVQNDVELPGPTGAGKDETPTLLPTLLQNHNDPVVYRNVWVIDRGLAGNLPFPVFVESSQE